MSKTIAVDGSKGLKEQPKTRIRSLHRLSGQCCRGQNLYLLQESTKTRSRRWLDEARGGTAGGREQDGFFETVNRSDSKWQQRTRRRNNRKDMKVGRTNSRCQVRWVATKVSVAQREEKELAAAAAQSRRKDVRMIVVETWNGVSHLIRKATRSPK